MSLFSAAGEVGYLAVPAAVAIETLGVPVPAAVSNHRRTTRESAAR